MPEFTVEKHGANKWVVFEDGHITDMRVADKRAGEIVIGRILGAQPDDSAGAVEPEKSDPDSHVHVYVAETDGTEIRLHHAHPHQLDHDPKVEHYHVIHVEPTDDGVLMEVDAERAADEAAADEAVVTLADIRAQLEEYAGILDLEPDDQARLNAAIADLLGDQPLTEEEKAKAVAGDTAGTDAKPGAPIPAGEPK